MSLSDKIAGIRIERIPLGYEPSMIPLHSPALVVEQDAPLYLNSLLYLIVFNFDKFNGN